jgi:hypothetical protein
MEANRKEKVVKKMIAKGLCTEKEYLNGTLSQERIEMFIKGIDLIEGETTVQGQIEARETVLNSFVNARDSSEVRSLRTMHSKALKKLRALRTKLNQKAVAEADQIKARFSGAKTQFEEVKIHLEEYRSITSWDAFKEYGITRLSAIIYRLRHEENWTINNVNITKNNRYGNPVTFAKYTIDEEADK